MLGPLLAFGIGFAAFAVAAWFFVRRQARWADLVAVPLRAIGLEERLGQEDDTWYHVVYEIAEGPEAGRRMVSELGHGGPPRLPSGVRTERVNPETGQVLTRGALRLEAVLIVVFGGAGLFAMGAAFWVAL